MQGRPKRVSRFGRIRLEIAAANLREVYVYALEVEGADKTVSYWQSLQGCWAEYFRTSGAALTSYTVLREVVK
jgi:hypothetical protein